MSNEEQLPSKPDYSAVAREKIQHVSAPAKAQTSPKQQQQRPLPSGYSNARWDKVPIEARRAMNVAASNGEWPIYLWGQAGRGKTCAAACAFSLWPKPAMWISLSQLCDDLTKFNTSQVVTFYSGATPVDLSKSGYWQRLKNTGLVVIDEIGTRESSGHRFDSLLNLLEIRKNRPLVLTGNLSSRQITQIYDERVLSRIYAGTVIEFVGVDHRFEGAEDRIHQT